MKTYLYSFTFYSGFYGDLFYKQTIALNHFDVIIELVTYFMDYEEEKSKQYLNDNLGENWTIEDFWRKMDLRFFNGSEGYTLHWIKEIDFDLNSVGKLI